MTLAECTLFIGGITMINILETAFDVAVFAAIVFFCINVSDSLRSIARSLTSARQDATTGEN